MPITAREIDLFQRRELPFAERCPIDMMDKFLRRRQPREFVERFKFIFRTARAENLQYFLGPDQKYFTRLFDLWFDLLARPGFQFADGDEELFLLGGNITNILAVTPHRNGDACIKKLVDQADNLAKLLHLYTPRSYLRMPVTPFFDANPILASLWYSSIWNWADCYVDEGVDDNCRYFLGNMDERFAPYDSNLIIGYFRCTYVDHIRDREVKRLFNRSIAEYISGTRIDNRPAPDSIAVVSAYWNGNHAVYRAFAPYVEELAKHYRLTLVDMRQPNARWPSDPSMFHRVCKIRASSEVIDVSAITNNDFQLAYFPDVGMSQESMYLSNLRIAPIQAMGTGHPVSSASKAMDYFISGGEVEAPGAKANYDERLVLLPGLSVHPVKPDFGHIPPPEGDAVVINCPWMHMKNNRRAALALRRILDRAERPLRFHFFPGCGASRNSSYMAFIQDYSTVLPISAFEILPDLEYSAYMQKLSEGSFTLHSYPFGGGTTAVDALVMGRPLVVLRGSHEYNRYSARLLERLRLEELIADDENSWVDLSTRLVNDREYLAAMQERVRTADLDQHLFKVENAGALRLAFDTLIRGHDEFKRDGSRAPIRIG
ncbi:MAG: hypothetical protein LBJ46_10315 [Planctomycetota bacterium]|jgi:hypothetical protein|nr:hypothetical protein [Planctomycetota bacterium]